MTQLNQMPLHQMAVITEMQPQSAMAQRLMALGLLPGVEVTLTRRAPLGDPIAIRVHGYELSLRCQDASQISVQAVERTF